LYDLKGTNYLVGFSKICAPLTIKIELKSLNQIHKTKNIPQLVATHRVPSGTDLISKTTAKCFSLLCMSSCRLHRNWPQGLAWLAKDY
jgi:hypothetical protein